MNKVIKIQNNIGKSMSYNAANIEAVLSGDMQQKIQFQTIDEYNLPIGTYLTLRNYDDILFDEATKQDNGDDGKVYAIIESGEVPDCVMMSNLYNTYASNECKGVVVISTNEEVYNQIVITTEQTELENFRIKDIYLNGEYSTLAEAESKLEDENPIILDFDEIYSKCARYWKKGTNNKKTSVFDTTQTTKMLPSFDGGYGDYKYEGNEEFNVEYWKTFTDQISDYIIPDGNYYLTTDEENSFEAKDSNYNIFDVLFRSIYDYLYSASEETIESNSENSEEVSPTVIDPSSYTFLLKTYKMYVKSSGAEQSNETTGNSRREHRLSGNIIPSFNFGSGNGITQEIASSVTSYSAKILTLDDIKELSADEAQEYFNNTIVYNNQEYLDKLVLSESEAKEVLLSKNINTCGKYFVISSNVCIKTPSSQQYEYFDLGNFELIYETPATLFTKSSKIMYKYNTNGQIVRVKQIYDPYLDENYNITKNNAGEFDEGYVISRKGVLVRGISGKEDYFYFEDSAEGNTEAEQLREDILYAMEDGPSIVVANSLIDIY